MSAELAPGALVARRYSIVRAVGAGGYGAVYEARDTVTGRPVALKILHSDRAERARDTRRFRREAALLQQLRHPHVLEVHELAESEDGLLYMACELLRGRSLREELRARGPLGLGRTLELGRAAAGALAYAHEAGIVHRDVKPANIMLCQGPGGVEVVKLLDFGIAKVLFGDENATKLTATGQMIGSPHYMAPEQVHGLRVDTSIDTYALGLVLAEALTGERVVRGATHMEICLAQASERPHAFAPAVASSPLGPIVAWAAQKSPAARPSARELGAALDAALRALGAPPSVAVAPVAASWPPSAVGPASAPRSVGDQARSGTALALGPQHAARIELGATVEATLDAATLDTGAARRATLETSSYSVRPPPPQPAPRRTRWAPWLVAALCAAGLAVAGVLALRAALRP
ncbi:MAG: serine/threonine protein kinase [Polyangiaceae bacterium]|nr:serine/threonine protein kinase [Polyangiaceae bacterium]